MKIWYKTFIEECPVCGATRKWKQRMKGSKPKSAFKRVLFETKYDQCIERGNV
jgi:hypothetical protein